MMRRSALLIGFLVGLTVLLMGMPAWAGAGLAGAPGSVVNGDFSAENGTDAVDWSANGNVSVTGSTYTGAGGYSTSTPETGGGRIAVLSTNGATAISADNHYQYYGAFNTFGYTTASSITQNLANVYGSDATWINSEQLNYINFDFNLVSNSAALSDPTLNAMPYVSFQLASANKSTDESNETITYPFNWQRLFRGTDAQSIANYTPSTFDPTLNGGNGGWVQGPAVGDYASSGWQQFSLMIPGINSLSWPVYDEFGHVTSGTFDPANVNFTIGLLGGQNGGGGNFDLLISSVTFSSTPMPLIPGYLLPDGQSTDGLLFESQELFEGLPAPEPSSAMLLLGLAISGLAVMRRRATA